MIMEQKLWKETKLLNPKRQIFIFRKLGLGIRRKSKDVEEERNKEGPLCVLC
jgi:hypothetical protein